MTDFVLDASQWQTRDDVYVAFFKAVGAPDWHGRNLDAIIDSIEHGGINAHEVPYRLVLKNYDRVGAAAQKMAGDFVDLIREIGARGCPVEITIEQ